MVYAHEKKKKPKGSSYATSSSPGHRNMPNYSGVFKVTSFQALNVEAHLTPITLELDKKTVQTAACFFSGPLYQIVTQSRSKCVRQTSNPLEILEKCYKKLLGHSIEELKKRPPYIVPPW